MNFVLSVSGTGGRSQIQFCSRLRYKTIRYLIERDLIVVAIVELVVRRHLLGVLEEAAVEAAVFDNVELMARSRSWVDHDYLVLREREIRRLVGAARRHQEQALFKTIAAVARPDREAWLPRLLAPIEDGGISRLEWLGAVPSGKGPTSLEAQIEKVGFLKQLGADRLGLRDLPLAGLTHFARRMMSRKAAALARQGSASDDRDRLLPASAAAAAYRCEPHPPRSPDRGPVARCPRACGGSPGEPAAPFSSTPR